MKKLKTYIVGLLAAVLLAVGITAAPAVLTSTASDASYISATEKQEPKLDLFQAQSADAGITYYPAKCYYSWTEYFGGFYSPVLKKWIPRTVWAVHYVYKAWWEPDWWEWLQGKRAHYKVVKRVSDNFAPFYCPKW